MIGRAVGTLSPDDHGGRAEGGVRVIEWSRGGDWDAFVDAASDGTAAHLWGWRGVMERAYGHRSFYLAAVDGDGLAGVLPLTLVTSRLFGRHLVSMPFLDYGGLCTDGRKGPAKALIEAAVELTTAERARLELRHLEYRPIGLPCSLEKVTMLLELETHADAQWKKLPSERRNRIRKGQRCGLSTTIHSADGLADFYDVWSTNMRALGSPPHSPDFFREMLTRLGDRARILLVRADGKAIGAAMMLTHRGILSIPWVSSLRRYFDRCPNQVLYWEAIRFAIEEGVRVLDFGRSTRGAGTFEAKRQWGAEPVQLYWHYFTDQDRPPADDTSHRLAWATRVWRHLPVAVANQLGPPLRKGIPN